MSTDVLISFDTTGSMSPCIAEVRRRIDESLSKLFSNIPDLRIAILAHGDYCDFNKPYDVIYTSFSDDKRYLKTFIKETPNTHGGDADECYEKVLHIANQMDWVADTRILLLIGDAEPHPVGYKYNSLVNYFDWVVEAQKLAEKKVSIYSIQALGRSGSNGFYTRIANLTNGRKLDLNQFTDAVETIIASCYHSVGKLDDYRVELESGFKLNRNLANMLKQLDSKMEISDVRYTKSDKSGLIPVSPTRFQIVNVDTVCEIKPFVESIGAKFKKGRGFYQFTKSEMVQENKEVVLRNKVTGDMFTGSEAREYIGLPFGTRGQIRPSYFADYEVYIQSTSTNRKLMPKTKFLYEVDY